MDNLLARLTDIEFSYDRSRTLLEGISLNIGRRDFIGITGPNGCGKSTFIKLLTGELRPRSGRIEYFLDSKAVPSISTGYMPQYSAVDKRFPISVHHLIESGLLSPNNCWKPFPSTEEKNKVVAAIERMNLTHIATQPIYRLSGGELQRAMLARAIVSSPRLLLLDEPDTYLDAESEARLFEILHTLNRECAIILVSHNSEAIREHCTKNILLGRRERE